MGALGGSAGAAGQGGNKLLQEDYSRRSSLLALLEMFGATYDTGIPTGYHLLLVVTQLGWLASTQAAAVPKTTRQLLNITYPEEVAWRRTANLDVCGSSACCC